MNEKKVYRHRPLKPYAPRTVRQLRALLYLEHNGKQRRVTPTAIADFTEGPCVRRADSAQHWNRGRAAVEELCTAGLAEVQGTRRHYTYAITDYGLALLALMREHGKITEDGYPCECLESAEN